MAQCIQIYSPCSDVNFGVNCYVYYDPKRTNPVSPGWLSDGEKTYTINEYGMVTAITNCVQDPYLACYALEITSGYTSSSCFGYQDTYEYWRIVLLDQFGNPFNATTTQTFNVNYYYQNNDDYYPTSEYVDTTITVNVGASEGFGYYLTNSTFPCTYSSACGPCTSQISQIGIVGVPVGLPGGCSAPPPTPPLVPFTLYAEWFFSPNGDGINDTFKIYTRVNGVDTELNYAAYPNATWEFYNRFGTVWYSNYSGGVYVPWNNYFNNDTSSSYNLEVTIFYTFNLNDGSGRMLRNFVSVVGLLNI
jgi:hypothetical protein